MSLLCPWKVSGSGFTASLPVCSCCRPFLTFSLFVGLLISHSLPSLLCMWLQGGGGGGRRGPEGGQGTSSQGRWEEGARGTRGGDQGEEKVGAGR